MGAWNFSKTAFGLLAILVAAFPGPAIAAQDYSILRKAETNRAYQRLLNAWIFSLAPSLTY